MEFLISELHRFVREFGRVPTTKDMGKKSGYPSYRPYMRMFGSWNNALLIAGLELNPTVTPRYTKEFLISELHRFVKENGRVPYASDFGGDSGYPSYRPYMYTFGSWNNALLEAGLELNVVTDITKEFLISELQRAYIELGRVPTMQDMGKNGYPSRETYRKYFHSWNQALIAAGLDVNNVYKLYTKEELISELHRFVYEYGHVPTIRDMDNHSGYPGSTAYKHVFGSWNKALIAAGLKPNTIIHQHDKLERCSICNVVVTCKWSYDKHDKLICKKCNTKIWTKNNPDKRKSSIHKHESKRRGYGSTAINNNFKYGHGHHLWLENRSDFVIFMPYFLHKLYYHTSNNFNSMTTVNTFALDYWINEDLYTKIYND